MISYDYLVFMVQVSLDVPKLRRAKQIGKRHTERVRVFKIQRTVSIMNTTSHGDLILSSPAFFLRSAGDCASGRRQI